VVTFPQGRVTDTFNGESRAYTNPGPLEPILDTAAFATCP
jgi:hypothetical protein